jgi:predicted regulator of Ras-like GTPase activity (Roadblock/LC7/MglB family)
MLVGGDDGLVIAESSMAGVKGNAVAALSASLVKKLGGAALVAGAGAPRFLHLQGERGVLLAVPAAHGILVVALADADVNVGLARLEMLRVAGSLV